MPEEWEGKKELPREGQPASGEGVDMAVGIAVCPFGAREISALGSIWIGHSPWGRWNCPEGRLGKGSCLNSTVYLHQKSEPNGD